MNRPARLYTLVERPKYPPQQRTGPVCEASCFSGAPVSLQMRMLLSLDPVATQGVSVRCSGSHATAVTWHPAVYTALPS